MMVASNTTIATDSEGPSSNQPQNDQTPQQTSTDPKGTNSCSGGQNKDAANEPTSITPISTSSTPSTASSGKTTTTTTTTSSHGSTHTMGKFKEKRPEPLNLIPSLNQEIPLDLSVKDAGSLPSGRIMNTLETPKIFWVDNEAQLPEQRLCSSSTIASQKIKLSSIAGDSPPITPITPFMELISPTIKSADYHQHSANFLLETNTSLQSLLSSQYQYSKHQLQNMDDNLLVSANKLTPTEKFLVHQFRGNNELIRTPRLSCSTDNLGPFSANGNLQSLKPFQQFRSQHQNNHRHMLQQNLNDVKNSISPLATKNLTSSVEGYNRFSYSGQQIAASCNGGSTTSPKNNTTKDRFSPIINVAIDQSQSNDNCLLGNVRKTHTPISVACATSNLLNIHLNSPTNQSPTYLEGLTLPINPVTSIKDLMTSDASSGAYRSTDQNTDPLISAAYCQHHQQNNILRSSLTSSSSSFGANENQDKHQQQHNLAPLHGHHSNLSGILTNSFTSLSSSTTLNTPTLVSPSQLKSGSSCFLQSPTLSPMSSVFDLPSPLLMFPPPNQNLLSQIEQNTNKSNKLSSPLSKETPEIPLSVDDSQPKIGNKELVDCDKSHTATIQSQNNDRASCTSELAVRYTSDRGNSNMDLLVTSAKDKMSERASVDAVLTDDTRMEIESGDQGSALDKNSKNTLNPVTKDGSQLQQLESTVIPRILVSDFRQKHDQHNLNEDQSQNINQRENMKPPHHDNIYAQQPQSTAAVFSDQAQAQYRNQRDVISKRALSPQSFKSRVSVYHNERLESSSAPPDVNQSRTRSKIKSITRVEDQQHQTDQYSSPSAQQPHPQATNQMSYHHSHYKTNAPYPEFQIRSFPVEEQQNLSIKTGYLTNGLPFNGPRPNSAEPCYGPYSQNKQPGGSQYHHDASSIAHQPNQQYQHYQQPLPQPQPQQLSSMSSSFSQSEQYLRSDWADVKPALSCPAVQHQCQSASSGELNRFQINSGSFTGLTTNQLANSAAQHHPQHQSHLPIMRTSVATHPLGAHNNNLQSPIVKLDDMIHQSPTPIQVESHIPLNQLSQGHASQYQGCEAMQSGSQQRPLQQPRAMSADIRGISRSDSSCSSVDFCFRSSSAASGTTAKKYQCDQCIKAFTRSDMLTRHKRLHSKERPFQCNECKQEFSRSDHLSTHMRTHTGEKPYKCKLCSYSACRKDMITRHMKVHNRTSPSILTLERG